MKPVPTNAGARRVPPSTAGSCAHTAAAVALLFALGACGGGGGSSPDGSLDLGGGLSMTADGQILGATAAASSVPDSTPDGRAASTAQLTMN